MIQYRRFLVLATVILIVLVPGCTYFERGEVVHMGSLPTAQPLNQAVRLW